MNGSPLSSVSPLAALAALLVIGVSIEVVEGQNREAAWVLVVTLLLGMLLVNTQWFNSEIKGIIALLNKRSSSGSSNGKVSSEKNRERSTA